MVKIVITLIYDLEVIFLASREKHRIKAKDLKYT